MFIELDMFKILILLFVSRSEFRGGNNIKVCVEEEC